MVKRIKRRYWWIFILVILVMLAGLPWSLQAIAAPNLQATPTLFPTVPPAPVQFPTATATLEQQFTITPTRTPTPVGPALAEALEGPTNVRAAPDIEAERLGQIFPGEFYPVIGRATGTLWLKIQYADSSTGSAWVFEQVVQLTGNIDEIPELNVSSEPTIDVDVVISGQTLEALVQTPGALETVTAEALLANGVVTEGAPVPTETSGPMPTFTYPPGVSAGEATPVAATQPQAGILEESGFPPIIPIVVLGVLGGLGLLIGVLRRMG